MPIPLVCKKQTAVSHSSTETEVISLDTGRRMEGLPARSWDAVIDVLELPATRAKGDPSRHNTQHDIVPHISQHRFLLIPEALSFNGGHLVQVEFGDPSKSFSSSTRGAMTKNLEGSWLQRAEPRNSVMAQSHTPSITSGASGSKTSNTCETHVDNRKCWSRRVARAQFGTEKDYGL